jgi:two-component system cell cycle response regulator DivK
MPRLLLVDDEPDNVELLRRRLSKRGFECLSAHNAADAIALAQTERPDLILMDKMPLVDGYEAMRQLRGMETTKAIPIIALTAHAMPEDRIKAIDAGANEYESKPVDLQSLLDKIAALLARPTG